MSDNAHNLDGIGATSNAPASKKRKREHHSSTTLHAASPHTHTHTQTKQPTPNISTSPNLPSAGVKKPEAESTSLSTENCAGGTKDDIELQTDSASTPKAQRFIVFIGNLPYSATDESISQHFAKIKPKSIRHITKKGSGESKGFAFLEFDSYDRMKTCLKLYHRSNFQDAKGKDRRLNVELTAGGGGIKSAGRREKLKVKNQRLNEQRERRTVQEAKAKKKRSQTGSSGEQSTTTIQPVSSKELALASGDIHPSRAKLIASQI